MRMRSGRSTIYRNGRKKTARSTIRSITPTHRGLLRMKKAKSLRRCRGCRWKSGSPCLKRWWLNCQSNYQTKKHKGNENTLKKYNTRKIGRASCREREKIEDETKTE